MAKYPHTLREIRNELRKEYPASHYVKKYGARFLIEKADFVIGEEKESEPRTVCFYPLVDNKIDKRFAYGMTYFMCETKEEANEVGTFSRYQCKYCSFIEKVELLEPEL